MGVGVLTAGVLWEISNVDSSQEPTPTSVEVIFTDSNRAELYDLVNKYRLEKGLQVVSVNPSLERAAQLKSNDMAEKDYWSHDSPDGTKPWAFFQEVSYNYTHAGENLARDYQSPSEIVDAWKMSKTHNDNLVSEYFKESGIGYTCNTGRCIVVMFYGTPIKAQVKSATTTRQTTKVAQPTPIPTVTPVATYKISNPVPT